LEHRPVIEQTSNQKLLAISIFAEVYLVDGKTIRKAPRSQSEDDIESIIREATIYNMMDDHPRIAECTSRGRTDFVDVKYYPKGDLSEFCQKNEVSAELQSKWFRQLIEAVEVIHRYGVIHSDLALRQFFVDDELNIRLGDFNSSRYPENPAVGYEKATHCLPRDYAQPNTVLSDLFALGSTLFELVTGKAPYAELYPAEFQDIAPSDVQILTRAQQRRAADAEVEKRFRNLQFPDVSHIFRGDVILGCWSGRFSSVEEVLRSSTNHICESN
jgi:serine/threonine protein kinase